MKLDDKIVEEILLKGSYISKGDLEKAKKNKKLSLLDSLYSLNILTHDLLGQAIAEHLKIHYADLNSNKPPKDLVLKLPENISRKYRAVLAGLDEKKKIVHIASSEPQNPDLVTEIQKKFPEYQLIISYALIEDIDDILIFYHKELGNRFTSILKNSKNIATDFINEILNDAVSYRASDIHLEPQDKDVHIRFRVDGVLFTAGAIDKKYYENILNKLKIQANLRIDEHGSAQDGAIRMKREGKKFDLRLSIVPIVNGEKVVIRVLAEYLKGYSLKDVGLSDEQEKMLTDSITKPIGMVVATGPTGSGKTTTLYSILKTLNNPNRNITTIEDPVEYKLEGINQIQVNKIKEITFSKGLRSVVRQDPDVILVGEIRDVETAQLAVNAALTGHLLLSTFHANDAATTIPRLIDMNVEPFLLASTLDLIVAQRLVRKICEKCRYSYTKSKRDIKKDNPNAAKYFTGTFTTLYKGDGCHSCNNTGYEGRTSVFEMIQITPDMKDLIIQKPSSRDVWKLAKKQGTKSMFEDGVRKVKAGETTLEELLRVTKPED